MPSSTISSKGQITIPKEIREALRVDSGDRIQFVVTAAGVVELRPETVDVLDLVGILEPARGRTATVEEMNDAVRNSAVKAFKKSCTR